MLEATEKVTSDADFSSEKQGQQFLEDAKFLVGGFLNDQLSLLRLSSLVAT